MGNSTNKHDNTSRYLLVTLLSLSLSFPLPCSPPLISIWFPLKFDFIACVCVFISLLFLFRSFFRFVSIYMNCYYCRTFMFWHSVCVVRIRMCWLLLIKIAHYDETIPKICSFIETSNDNITKELPVQNLLGSFLPMVAFFLALFLSAFTSISWYFMARSRFRYAQYFGHVKSKNGYKNQSRFVSYQTDICV